MAFPRRRFLGELPRSGRTEVLFSLFVAARKRAREPERGTGVTKPDRPGLEGIQLPPFL
jgi:hypothetical protein